jgi:nucleoside-triphosphatase THEP1
MRVIIWTGPIHSGKTTRLADWLKGRDAGGILTPKTDGKRWFRDLAGGRTFLMDASENSKSVVQVGKHCFDAAAFSEASGIIRQAINRHEWLVMDEIGPLELRGEGFADILQEVMLRQQAGLVLVIREGLVNPITEKFSITADEIVRPAPELFIPSEHVDRAPGA